MKTYNVITDFGIKELTIIAKKLIQNELFAISKVPVKYMNSEEPLYIKKIVHIKSGTPIASGFIKFSDKDSAKEILEKASLFLSSYDAVKFSTEINKYTLIN